AATLSICLPSSPPPASTTPSHCCPSLSPPLRPRPLPWDQIRRGAQQHGRAAGASRCLKLRRGSRPCLPLCRAGAGDGPWLIRWRRCRARAERTLLARAAAGAEAHGGGGGGTAHGSEEGDASAAISACWPAQQPIPGGGTAEWRRAGRDLRPWHKCATAGRRRCGAARLPASRCAPPALARPIAVLLRLALPKAYQGEGPRIDRRIPHHHLLI
ncbi:unnamed protein product, partial [Urochloa humidicola]